MAEDGMHWKAGEQMAVYKPGAPAVDTVLLPDDVSLDIESYNRRVVTENFNRVVCAQLAKHGDYPKTRITPTKAGRVAPGALLGDPQERAPHLPHALHETPPRRRASGSGILMQLRVH